MKNFPVLLSDDHAAVRKGLRLLFAEINQDQDQFAAKTAQSSHAAKAEGKPKLQALQEQATKLNRQFDEAKSAAEPTWG